MSGLLVGLTSFGCGKALVVDVDKKGLGFVELMIQRCPYSDICCFVVRLD